MESESKLKHSRRDFINWFIGVGVAGWIMAIIYPVIKYILPPKMPEPKISSVKVAKIADIKPGSGTIFKFGNKPAILIKLENGELRAFSATCTHLDCTVQYNQEQKIIWCACHNGKYDLSGKNISGPPPRPLEGFKVILKGDDIFVSKES